MICWSLTTASLFTFVVCYQTVACSQLSHCSVLGFQLWFSIACDISRSLWHSNWKVIDLNIFNIHNTFGTSSTTSCGFIHHVYISTRPPRLRLRIQLSLESLKHLKVNVSHSFFWHWRRRICSRINWKENMIEQYSYIY